MPDQLPVQTSQPGAHAGVLPPESPTDPVVMGSIPVDASDIYDARTLGELEVIFGRPKLRDLLGRLRLEIAQRLQAPVTERVALGRDAHTLLSVSGSLGFVELSRRCTEMEQACLTDAELAVPLEAARRAAARAIAMIDTLHERP